METKIAEDIGEEIISRLRELLAILKIKAKEKENEKKLTHSYPTRN
jgi:hypothetical protein